MKFDYPHTCPEIDRNIQRFEDELETTLTDILNELCPIVEDFTTAEGFRKRWISRIIPFANDLFEDVRKCNSDLRTEAEKTIDSANQEIDELNETIKGLEYQSREYEKELDKAQDEIYDLQSRISG